VLPEWLLLITKEWAGESFWIPSSARQSWKNDFFHVSSKTTFFCSFWTKSGFKPFLE